MAGTYTRCKMKSTLKRVVERMNKQKGYMPVDELRGVRVYIMIRAFLAFLEIYDEDRRKK